MRRGGGGGGGEGAGAGEGGGAPRLGYSALRAGLAFAGKVTKVADFGVFVALDGTDRFAAPGGGGGGSSSSSSSSSAPAVPISGLCHVSEVSEAGGGAGGKGKGGGNAARGALGARFAVGDAVKVVVLSYAAEGNKLALSMRPSRLATAQDASAASAEGMEEEVGEE